MPQIIQDIQDIKKKVFQEGKFDINMLMDQETGMTLEVWVNYYGHSPGLLAHLRRKAFDWIHDYGGLTAANLEVLKGQLCNSSLVLNDRETGQQEAR